MIDRKIYYLDFSRLHCSINKFNKILSEILFKYKEMIKNRWELNLNELITNRKLFYFEKDKKNNDTIYVLLNKETKWDRFCFKFCL